MAIATLRRECLRGVGLNLNRLEDLLVGWPFRNICRRKKLVVQPQFEKTGAGLFSPKRSEVAARGNELLPKRLTGEEI